MYMFLLQNPLVIGSMLHVECVFFALCSLALVGCMSRTSVDKNHICKMAGLTGLHDLYDSFLAFVHSPFSFRSLNPFCCLLPGASCL